MTEQEPGAEADGARGRPSGTEPSAPEPARAYAWDTGAPITPGPVVGSAPGAPDLPGAHLGASPGDHAPGSSATSEGRADPSAAGSRGPRLLLRAAVLGVAIALVAGVALALGALNHGLHSPRAQVAAYLTALEEGRFSDAAAHLAGPDGVTNGLLLTDAIGASTTHRLSGHEILEVDRSGDDAQVTARVEQDGVVTIHEFTLHRLRSAVAFFPRWVLEPPAHDMLKVFISSEVDTLTVNGVSVGLAGLVTQTDVEYQLDVALLPIFPGDYEILYDIEDSALITSLPTTVRASGEWAGLPYDTWPEWELSEQGQEQAREKLSEKLVACAASTSPAPLGCPFAADVPPHVTEGSWTVDVVPEVEIEKNLDGLLTVRSQPDAGSATFTYLDTASGLYDPRIPVTVPFTVTGTIQWSDTGEMALLLGGS